jgi:hypothetical protein
MLVANKIPQWKQLRKQLLRHFAVADGVPVTGVAMLRQLQMVVHLLQQHWVYCRRRKEERCQLFQYQDYCIEESYEWQPHSLWNYPEVPGKMNCQQGKEDPGSTVVHPPTRY